MSRLEPTPISSFPSLAEVRRATPDTKHFLGSIRSLLQLAAGEARAEGFAFYEFDQARRNLELRISHHLPARDPGDYPAQVTERPLRLASSNAASPAVMTFPLQGVHGLAGIVDFGFRDPQEFSSETGEILRQAATAIEAILRASSGPSAVPHLAARIHDLEAELADQKIGERAQGLLRDGGKRDRMQVLCEHVDNVLGFRPVERLLQQQVQDLESKVVQRKLVANAKALLQESYGCTEEEAYLRLRDTSRRTRTRLGDVAREIISLLGPRQESGRLSA